MLQRLRTAFHGQLATVGQSLETAVPLQGQVQAALAVKAVISKGFRTAPNASKASHGFSWAACDGRSKLGDSCATPEASTGSFGRQSCHFSRDSGLPRQRFKGFARLFMGSVATVGQSLETAVPLQGQVQAALAVKAVISKGSRPAPPMLQRLRRAFHGQLATVGQSLETAVTIQGEVLAPLINASAFGQRLFFLAFFASAPV